MISINSKENNESIHYERSFMLSTYEIIAIVLELKEL